MKIKGRYIQKEKARLIRISLVVALTLATGVSLAAIAGSIDKPNDLVRGYIPISTGTDVTLGKMKLSKYSVSFSKLTGKMQLQYVGFRKPENGETEFSGDVYQVVNADTFFKSNKGKNGFCNEPIRWVTISTNDAGIRVGMLTSIDWKKYTLSSVGGCSADTFALE